MTHFKNVWASIILYTWTDKHLRCATGTQIYDMNSLRKMHFDSVKTMPKQKINF